MINALITVIMTGVFIYVLFTLDEPTESKPKTPKKYIKVKRNGQWVDEEM